LTCRLKEGSKQGCEEQKMVLNKMLFYALFVEL
jgi:hypothetical protein